MSCICNVVCLSIFSNSSSRVIRASNSFPPLDFLPWPILSGADGRERSWSAAISHILNRNTLLFGLRKQNFPTVSAGRAYHRPQPLNVPPLNVPHCAQISYILHL